MDVFTLAVFAATFTALVAGYLVWGAIGRACHRAQLASDIAATRLSSIDGGRYVGGQDKVGSN